MFGSNKKKTGFYGKRIYSIEEYLDIEKQVTETYEFWDEIVIKLNNDFNNFYKGLSNLRKRFVEKLGNENGRVFLNLLFKKQKVWIESENCLFYPDLFVVDEVIEFYQNKEDVICNPTMIIEASTVHSMGKMNGKSGDNTYLNDRTSKFWNYQKIPSLKEYVLISDIGDTVVETYNRMDEENWKYQIFSRRENDLVKFESIDVTFPVKDIYL